MVVWTDAVVLVNVHLLSALTYAAYGDLCLWSKSELKIFYCGLQQSYDSRSFRCFTLTLIFYRFDLEHQRDKMARLRTAKNISS